MPAHKIAEQLHRTIAGVAMRIHFLKRPDLYKIQLKRQRDVRRSTALHLGFNLGPSAAEISARPTDEMIAERDARLKAPRSTVAWLMGDPAPGYSALDRRGGAR
jgi:hypothetical protein